MDNFLKKYLYPNLLFLYLSTIRINFRNDYNKDAIFIFWHSNMLAGWKVFKGKLFTALVSKSNDGEILTNLLRKFSYKIIRGSSSKDGKKAIEEILNDKDLTSVVLTPDGPRGPSNVIKNGALILSNKLNIPIIPVKIRYNKFFVLRKSWDKFKIPYPFSKCEVTFGNEYFYPEYLELSELEKYKHLISSEI